MPLLDRLKAGSNLPPEKDIALHLERLLNLRKGSLALDRELGLEAQSQLHLAADEQRFQDLMTRIAEQVSRYEPRLQPKSLDFTPLGQALLLKGRLVASQQSVEFLLVFGQDNYLQVHLPESTTYQKVLAHV
ncbi:GPW/gp25 family protein [Marinospirillum sp.]|uniref:GPW/gp25 family protein n=1 Tax=Marinospirillum sp. TaxID=2183934 RepID=UPI002870428C|nr:GPW/gp25 family protein [Marinospirillum sp.]MDR9467441.1 GPW/gp25 family protein [Marinospirillum sp.]